MATLDPAVSWSTGFWDGQHAYLLGLLEDRTGITDRILRFDPATLSVTVLDARLPRAGILMGVAWTGQHAYIFGGRDTDSRALDTIVRFTPATGAVEVMGARLTRPTAGASAVWDGQRAYIFGGTGPGEGRIIQRYDPVAERVEEMGATLSPGRWFSAAVWMGNHAYVLGGGSRDDVWLDEVLRYDPVADNATVVARLPSGRQTLASSAVVVDDHAYLFGGFTCTGGCKWFDEIVRYQAGADRTVKMSSPLPSGRASVTAAWDERHAYVFGGSGASSQIVRYTLSPGAPPSGLAAPTMPAVRFSLSQGLEVGPMLTWAAPPESTYHPPLTYRVYRAAAAAGPYVLVGEAGDTTFTHYGAEPLARNYYAVSAANRFGEGPRGPPLCWHSAVCRVLG